MSDSLTSDQTTGQKPRFDWDDPNVPVGNAPPSFPRWPLVMAALVWVAWVVFLFVMMLETRSVL